MPFLSDEEGNLIEIPEGLTDAQRRALGEMFAAPNVSARGVPVGAIPGAEFELPLRPKDIEEQLPGGAKLERDPSGQVVELNRPLLRADLARSNLPDEQQLKMMQSFDALPQGTEIFRLHKPGKPESFGGFAIRLPGTETFKLLDSEQITLSDAAEIAAFLLSEEVVLGTGAAVAASTLGAGLPLVAAAAGAGGFAGVFAKSGVERVRGFELDPENTLAHAIETGLLFAIAEPVTRVVAPFFGAGFRKITAETKLALETGKRIAEELKAAGEKGLVVGLEELGGPLARTGAKQAGMMSAATEAKLAGRRTALTRSLAVQANRVGDPGKLSAVELNESLNRVVEALPAAWVSVRMTGREQAGVALTNARKGLVRFGRERLKRLFDETRAEALRADITYDFRPAIEWAQKMRKGVKAAGEPVEVQTGLLGPTGQALTITTTKSVQLRRLQGDLAKVVDDINKISPTLRHFEDASAYEQLRELRSKLWDLKSARIEGFERQLNHLAGEGWDVLTKIMNSPQGKASEAFLTALQRANRSTRTLERWKEVTIDMAEVLRRSPEELAQQFAFNFSKGSTLRQMRKMYFTAGERENWELFRDGARSMLVREPERIGPLVDRTLLDPEAKRVFTMFVSDVERGQFQTYGQQAVALKDILRSLVADGASARKFVGKVVDRDDAAQILSGLVKSAGGKDSGQGRAYAASLITEILERTVTEEAGRLVLNPKAANALIRKWEADGVLAAVLPDAERAFLLDKASFMSFFRTVGDAGTAIQRAQTVANLNAVFQVFIGRGTKAMTGLVSGTGTVFQNMIAGWLYTNPTVRAIMLSTEGARRRSIQGVIRIANMAMVNAIADLNAVRDALGEPRIEEDIQKGAAEAVTGAVRAVRGAFGAAEEATRPQPIGP